MKYCVRYSRKFNYIDKVDEFKIVYKPNHEKLLAFLELYSEKRIIISFTVDDIQEIVLSKCLEKYTSLENKNFAFLLPPIDEENKVIISLFIKELKKNNIEYFFNEKLYSSMGIHTTIKEKTIRTQFEDFIDCRTIDYGDIIEEFTFKYVNTKHCPTTRIPKELTEEMEMRSKILETYGALSATTTMKLGTGSKTDKLKQLSAVVGYSSDNAFDLVVKFRNYGEYTCNENIIAKYPMNEIVISNYKEYMTPEIETSDFDLTKWLDEVFYKVKERKDDKEIPTKPKR